MLNIVKKESSHRVIIQCVNCGAHQSKDYYSARTSHVGDQCFSCADIITNMVDLDPIILNAYLDYNAETGSVVYRRNTRKYRVGDNALYAHSQGYLSITIGRRAYLAHRVIWLMVTGSMPNNQIDHIDHNRANNAWRNLREVTARNNQLNMSKRNSHLGITGVRITPSGKYSAYIMVNRKQISLGSYVDLDDAVNARKLAEVKYGFHSNHGK